MLRLARPTYFTTTSMVEQRWATALSLRCPLVTSSYEKTCSPHSWARQNKINTSPRRHSSSNAEGLFKSLDLRLAVLMKVSRHHHLPPLSADVRRGALRKLGKAREELAGLKIAVQHGPCGSQPLQLLVPEPYLVRDHLGCESAREERGGRG